MQLSPEGRRLIQGFEGFSATAYPDAAGYSIGYGHFGASPGDVITREEADRLFDRDVAKYELAVSTVVPNASQSQFDAMTSLAYNIGTGGFAGSTVARLHNLGDYAGAADAFRLWNKSQGKVHQGLVKRREREREVYLSGFPQTHFPMEGISVQPTANSPEPPTVPAVELFPVPPSSGWEAVPTPAKAGGIAGIIAILGLLAWKFLTR